VAVCNSGLFVDSGSVSASWRCHFAQLIPTGCHQQAEDRGSMSCC